MGEIYLDNAAATPVDRRVANEMARALKQYGNPSSFNIRGRSAREEVDSARFKIACFLGARAEEIIFTSSGSEANSLAILGLGLKKGEMITTAIEHKSVLKPAERIRAVVVGVDSAGFVKLDELRKAMSEKIKLISVMYANNEIGTIQPIIKIGKLIKEFKKKLEIENCRLKIDGTKPVLFHVDACQAAGFLDMNVNHLGVDLLTFNGSKIYGPRGVGVLYARRGVTLRPLVLGGEQEFGLRAGTENLPAIVGLAEAIKRIDLKETAKISGLCDYFISQLQKRFPEAKINGPIGEHRLSNNVSVSFPDADVERLLLELDKYGIRAGSGSACTSRAVEPSHVLVTIGNEKKYLHALRFSLGRQTTKNEVEYVLGVLKKILLSVSVA